MFFVTFNTHERKRTLATASVCDALVKFAAFGKERGIAVGSYVIMPDHIHVFVGGGRDFVLCQWVRLLKRHLSKAVSDEPPHWQEGFFDHLSAPQRKLRAEVGLRTAESG